MASNPEGAANDSVPQQGGLMGSIAGMAHGFQDKVLGAMSPSEDTERYAKTSGTEAFEKSVSAGDKDTDAGAPEQAVSGSAKGAGEEQAQQVQESGGKEEQAQQQGSADNEEKAQESSGGGGGGGGGFLGSLFQAKDTAKTAAMDAYDQTLGSGSNLWNKAPSPVDVEPKESEGTDRPQAAHVRVQGEDNASEVIGGGMMEKINALMSGSPAQHVAQAAYERAKDRTASGEQPSIAQGPALKASGTGEAGPAVTKERLMDSALDPQEKAKHAGSEEALNAMSQGGFHDQWIKAEEGTENPPGKN